MERRFGFVVFVLGKTPLIFSWVVLVVCLGCDAGLSGRIESPRSVSPQPECDDCPSAKVLPDPEPGPGETINPYFLSWRNYPEGTLTVRVTRDADGTEIREQTKMVEKKDRTITLLVEVDRVEKGTRTVEPPRSVTLAFLIPQNGSSTGRNLDATPMSVGVLGKTFPSFLSESRGTDTKGSFVARRWDSDSVPGLLIRSEIETTPVAGGSVRKTVTELVELQFPNWDPK